MKAFITASEISRQLFCARALAYDHIHPEMRDQSLLGQLRRLLASPIKTLLLVMPFLVLFAFTDPQTAAFSIGVALVLLIIGRFIMMRIRYAPSLIIYHGTRAVRNRKTLSAGSFGLVGKPDYLLQIDQGSVIPVLVKKNPSPESPHEAHIMQVIAYCLLVAEARNSHPPYGVIRYGDGRTFEIDFDEDSVEVLSGIMDKIETNRGKRDIPRSHDDPRRCYACSHRDKCDQRLA